MNETIKYGIVGTGVMGQEHIQNINIIETISNQFSPYFVLVNY